MDNRRKFLVDLAAMLGFDPLQPKNWETVTNAQVRANNVCIKAHSSKELTLSQGRSLFAHYTSLQDALVDTFPEMDFSMNGE